MEELAAVRALMDEAFDGAFTDADWEHATGGVHVVLHEEERVVAHAAVVPRTLHLGGRAWSVGYVESVATAPDRQGAGLGTAVMRAAAAIIVERYELGALSTGVAPFYERLGWQQWRGPTSVRSADGLEERTEDDDGGVYVLVVGAEVDLDGPIACEARPGDVW